MSMDPIKSAVWLFVLLFSVAVWGVIALALLGVVR